MKTAPLIAAALFLLARAPLDARPLTPLDVATLDRLGAPALSPDGRTIAYQVRATDLPANRGRIDLYLLDISRPKQAPRLFASTRDANETSPAFSPDGKALYFLSDASGDDQIWRAPIGGGQPVQVTHAPGGIAGFKLSPVGDRVAVWADRPVGARTLADVQAPAKPDAGSGRVYDGLFARHWDVWKDGQRSQLFVLPLDRAMDARAGVSVMGSLVGDSPSRPFGGGEEIAWSADGGTLYFALREAGRNEAVSTNLDIFAAPADGSRPPLNLTDGNDATDTLPAVSPDGRWLAYAAMTRPGYESDRQVLMLQDLATGDRRALTRDWDRSVGSIAWSADSRTILVTAQEVLDNPVFGVDAATGRVTRLTGAGSAGNVVPLADGGFAYTLNGIQAPDELWRADARGRAAVRLTSINGRKLAGIDEVSVERFSFRGARGETVWGQIVKPRGAKGRLPTAMLVHGGPQGSFGDGWSYRWNPKLFAAHGLATVMIDFHGSTGYGQAFTDSINRDWGGKPLEDLKLGLAAAAARDPSVDPANACALGASYGGYMMNWIQGNWPDGFKCLVNHDGLFDLRAMAFETEELWFDQWEQGGPWWTRADAEKWNPVRFSDIWKTPMLVIHGEKDFRIPVTQGIAAFQALQMRNIPSRLLVFPDENHWVLKPKNSLQWHAEVFAWLDKWLGK